MEDKLFIEKAREFAARAHANDRQTDAEKSPRFPHFVEVAGLVEESGGSAVEIAAAWLHDTVEDTPTTIQDIKNEFGEEVASIVHGLTDPLGWEELPVAERKAKQAERVRSESPSIRLIKLADQISNVQQVGSKVFLNMQGERAIAYVKGAKMIADGCKGVSPLLDQMFQQRYEAALENLLKD